MAATESSMLELGTKAPYFLLPDTHEKMVSLDDFKKNPALMVMFICNHCPFVKHLRSGLAAMARDFQAKEVGVVGINSNDINFYPEDSPANMAQEVIRAEYSFPYLYDETQTVAKAYRAACTPDFYLFDSDQRLVYRGQMDDSRPGNGIPVTGVYMRKAVEDLLAGRPISIQQKPSIGCNIKWKPGNEPDYFNK